MVRRETTSEGLLLTWDRGECLIARLAPGVVFERLKGHLAAEAAIHIYTEGERLFDQALKNVVFLEWSEMTGYDSDARYNLSTWVKETSDSYLAIHVLFRSKIVAMGVSVGNLVLGGLIQATSSRSLFEQRLALHIPQQHPTGTGATHAKP